MNKPLKATWSLEVLQALTFENSLDIEKDVMDAASKEITKEIDQEIMRDLLKAQGWTEVIVKSAGTVADQLNQSWVDLEMWCDQNCKGKYTGWGTSWIFEKREDATFFALKWT